jgi:hypothetical protein
MNDEINYDSFGDWAISKEMFDWILNNVPEGSVILELGSGEGTKELVKRYTVYSVEHDENWVGLEPKSNYIFAELVNGWYDNEVLKREIPKKYDLIIIDGPPGELRENITEHLSLFDGNTIIIVDDTNREIDNKITLEISKKFDKTITEITSEDKKFSILK